MVEQIQVLIGYMFQIVPFLFLIAIVATIVGLVRSGKVQDPVAKKAAQKKAWGYLMYPVLIFVLLVAANGLLSMLVTSFS